jgi:hypothetical protein
MKYLKNGVKNWSTYFLEEYKRPIVRNRKIKLLYIVVYFFILFFTVLRVEPLLNGYLY